MDKILLVSVILILGLVESSICDEQVNYKAANREFDKYIDELGLPSYFGRIRGIDEDLKKYDVTGDGCEDLVRCLSYGSGMPRVSISIYDPIEHKGYILDSYNYSYRIESCDEDGLVVTKYEPRKNEEITGTIILEDDKLVFVEN